MRESDRPVRVAASPIGSVWQPPPLITDVRSPGGSLQPRAPVRIAEPLNLPVIAGTVHKYEQTDVSDDGFRWVWTRDDLGSRATGIAFDADENVIACGIGDKKAARYRPTSGNAYWLSAGGTNIACGNKEDICGAPDGSLYFSGGSRVAKLNEDGSFAWSSPTVFAGGIDLRCITFDSGLSQPAASFNLALLGEFAIYNPTSGAGGPTGTDPVYPETAFETLFFEYHAATGFFFALASTFDPEGLDGSRIPAVFRFSSVTAHSLDAFVTIPTYAGHITSPVMMAPCSDGGFVVIYNATGPGFPGLLRYDSDFAPLWTANYSGTDVAVDGDDNVFALGRVGDGLPLDGQQKIFMLSALDGSLVKYKNIPPGGGFADLRVNTAGDVFVSGARQPRW